MEEIKKEFGSFDAFKAYFSAQTAAVQGSGWGWLVRGRERLHLAYLHFD